MQVNCSELVIHVQNIETAEKLLLRALELTRRIEGVVSYVYYGYKRIELPRIPSKDDVVFKHLGGNEYGLVLKRPEELIRRKINFWKLRKEPVSLEYDDGGASISLMWTADDGYALYYGQHTQPELYPVIAQLSYEYRAPIYGYDGGHVTDLVFWLENQGIKYDETASGGVIVLSSII